MNHFSPWPEVSTDLGDFPTVHDSLSATVCPSLSISQILDERIFVKPVTADHFKTGRQNVILAQTGRRPQYDKYCIRYSSAHARFNFDPQINNTVYVRVLHPSFFANHKYPVFYVVPVISEEVRGGLNLKTFSDLKNRSWLTKPKEGESAVVIIWKGCVFFIRSMFFSNLLLSTKALVFFLIHAELLTELAHCIAGSITATCRYCTNTNTFDFCQCLYSQTVIKILPYSVSNQVPDQKFW
jgi:hypothetical protein